MALTLVTAQKLIQDELRAGVIRSIYINNPIFALLPFENISGNAISYNRENGLASGGTSRAINADYSEGTADFTRLTANLGRLGGVARVDNFLQSTGSNVNDQLAVQVEAKSKAVAVRFQNEFFNGDTSVDPNGFDGLKKLVDGTSRELEVARVLTPDDLDAALLQVDGDASAIFMNNNTFLKIQKDAKERVQFNSLELVGSRLSTYAGVPVLRAGVFGGSQILADGEVYVVRMGVDGVHGIQNNLPTPTVFAPDATSPSHTVRIDWYTGIAQKSAGSVYRIAASLTEG